MGGPSAERAVSLRSGAAIARGLREAGYETTEVDVRDRNLRLPGETDAVFLALHGEFGEDGEIQSLLNRMGIPYTGSGAAASRLAFDKALCKPKFLRNGIPTPAYEILERGQPRRLPLPVVTKPPRQGSSVGAHRVFTEPEWPAAAEDTLRYGDAMLVEAYVPGRELTVGIVDREALPAVEIVAPDGWYDYRAKYTQGLTSYRVPAPLDDGIRRACREIALEVFHTLGCRGLGRVDFRLSPDNRLYALEINTIPGFTETSLLPKAAAAAGMDFPSLCDAILLTARTDGPEESASPCLSRECCRVGG
jgi:D-alanine-D-alanine ligase